MKKKIKTGLIFGKFAPLHRGHQFVIETALKEMDKVIVVIYDRPEITDLPLKMRVNWLKKLYPQVEIIEALDSPKEYGREPERIRQQTDYLVKKIFVPVTHVYSNEWYGGEVAKVLGAKNRLVDVGRKKFPVSGTLIRSNIEKYKKFLDPLVYKDLIKS